MIENERRDLDGYHKAMVERIEAVHTLAGKQMIVPRSTTASSPGVPADERAPGIVFMPAEVVDFIICSANNTMHTAFGQSLRDPGVAIIEPKTSDSIGSTLAA